MQKGTAKSSQLKTKYDQAAKNKVPAFSDAQKKKIKLDLGKTAGTIQKATKGSKNKWLVAIGAGAGVVAIGGGLAAVRAKGKAGDAKGQSEKAMDTMFKVAKQTGAGEKVEGAEKGYNVVNQAGEAYTKFAEHLQHTNEGWQQQRQTQAAQDPNWKSVSDVLGPDGGGMQTYDGHTNPYGTQGSNQRMGQVSQDAGEAGYETFLKPKIDAIVKPVKSGWTATTNLFKTIFSK
jgi:hypothetical protein